LRQRAIRHQILSSKISRLHSFKEFLERREIFRSNPKEDKDGSAEMTAKAGRLSLEAVHLFRAELAAISDTKLKVATFFRIPICRVNQYTHSNSITLREAMAG
jgi:hypothetical protein